MRWSPKVATLSILAAVAVAGLGANGSNAAKPGGPNTAALPSPALAAHACQGDGYLSLTRLQDGTGFKNVGECVSYATQGGRFSAPLKSCTVTAKTGCITYDHEQLSDGQGHTVTVSGVFSFDSTCSGCSYSFPNQLGTGAGTYTETDASGATIATGTLTAAGANVEGLAAVRFNAATCSASSDRTVDVMVSVTDQSAPNAYLGAETGSAPSSHLQLESQTKGFDGSAGGVTIDC